MEHQSVSTSPLTASTTYMAPSSPAKAQRCTGQSPSSLRTPNCPTWVGRALDRATTPEAQVGADPEAEQVESSLYQEDDQYLSQPSTHLRPDQPHGYPPPPKPEPEPDEAPDTTPRSVVPPAPRAIQAAPQHD